MLSKTIGVCAGLCLMVGGVCGLSTARAQETASATPPPKVLVIDIEWLKPGKGGSAHQKTESAFIEAAKKFKSAPHYVGMDALSGPPRSLFVFGYDSFAEMEKEQQMGMSDASFTAATDQAFAEDGELLSSTARNIFTLRDDLLHDSGVALGTMRYLMISRVTIRPGHQTEWEEYIKMYASTIAKSEPEHHAALYQSAFGWENGGAWLLIRPMKSLDEVDKDDAGSAKFREAMGADNLKRYRELAASCVVSSQRNLYAFNPEMSYVTDAMASQDPSYWKHK